MSPNSQAGQEKLRLSSFPFSSMPLAVSNTRLLLYHHATTRSTYVCGGSRIAPQTFKNWRANKSQRFLRAQSVYQYSTIPNNHIAHLLIAARDPAHCLPFPTASRWGECLIPGPCAQSSMQPPARLDVCVMVRRVELVNTYRYWGGEPLTVQAPGRGRLSKPCSALERSSQRSEDSGYSERSRI